MSKQVSTLRAEMEDARKSAEEAAKNNSAADRTSNLSDKQELQTL